MTRREFRCDRCQALLAKVDEPNYVLRIEAASFTYNCRNQSLMLRCQCGYNKTISVPRQVDVFSSERVSSEAA